MDVDISMPLRLPLAGLAAIIDGHFRHIDAEPAFFA